VLVGVTVSAVASALPPLSTLLMQLMLTQMLVQIPLIFIAAAFWSEYLSWPTGTRWKQWNAQGTPGLLFSAMVMVYWMTPIALDHAATDSLWETAKVASLAAAGISAFRSDVGFSKGSEMVRSTAVSYGYWVWPGSSVGGWSSRRTRRVWSFARRGP